MELPLCARDAPPREIVTTSAGLRVEHKECVRHLRSPAPIELDTTTNRDHRGARKLTLFRGATARANAVVLDIRAETRAQTGAARTQNVVLRRFMCALGRQIVTS